MQALPYAVSVFGLHDAALLQQALWNSIFEATTCFHLEHFLRLDRLVLTLTWWWPFNAIVAIACIAIDWCDSMNAASYPVAAGLQAQERSQNSRIDGPACFSLLPLHGALICNWWQILINNSHAHHCLWFWIAVCAGAARVSMMQEEIQKMFGFSKKFFALQPEQKGEYKFNLVCFIFLHDFWWPCIRLLLQLLQCCQIFCRKSRTDTEQWSCQKEFA